LLRGDGSEEGMDLGEELLRALGARAEWGGEGWEVGSGGELGAGFVPRTIGFSLAQVIAASDEDEDTPLACLSTDGVGEGGLADTGLTTDEHEAAGACDGGGEPVGEQDLFALAADEERRGGGSQSGRTGSRADGTPPEALRMA
jgi:hypothetical protein